MEKIYYTKSYYRGRRRKIVKWDEILFGFFFGCCDVCLCSILFISLYLGTMFSDLNLNIVVPMLSLGLFVFGFITFMIYHENRLKDLEDKAPDDRDPNDQIGDRTASLPVAKR